MNLEKVKDVMTRNVQTCTMLDNIYEVAVKMKQYNIGAVPVVHEGRIAGIITDRDLVLRGYAEKNPGSTKAEKVMTSNVITVQEEDTVNEAVRLMEKYSIRRLPVLAGEELSGILSLTDITRDDYAKAVPEKITEEEETEQFLH